MSSNPDTPSPFVEVDHNPLGLPVKINFRSSKLISLESAKLLLDELKQVIEELEKDNSK